jgi:hypothetical protein
MHLKQFPSSEMMSLTKQKILQRRSSSHRAFDKELRRFVKAYEPPPMRVARITPSFESRELLQLARSFLVTSPKPTSRTNAQLSLGGGVFKVSIRLIMRACLSLHRVALVG